MIGKRKVFGVVSGAGKAVVSWSEESGSAAAVEYRKKSPEDQSLHLHIKVPFSAEIKVCRCPVL